MMDPSYNMDVDDLFGDSEHVNLQSISVPPVKGLARRVDELGASGCCQYVHPLQDKARITNKYKENRVV